MKKSILLTSLVMLLALPTFAGCNSDKDSSNLITSGTDNSLKSHNAKMENMLESLRKSVRFEGRIEQNVTFLTSLEGTPTGEEVKNVYLPNFVYDNRDGNKFGSTVYQEVEGGENALVYDNQLYEGEDGYTYYNALNYDNTIQGFPLLTYSGQKIAFAYAYLNPFHYLVAEDFIEVEGKENTYTLNKAKGTFFSSCVLSDIDIAFSDIVDTIEFVVEDYQMKSIKVIPYDDVDETLNYETFEVKYYKISQVATLDVKDVGVASINIPSVKETKDSHAALQGALDKFKGNNYTATLDVEITTDSANKKGTYTYYYDGSSLYITAGQDQTEPQASDILLYQYEGEEYLTPLMYDAASSKFTKDAAESLKEMDGVLKYNDVAPKVSEVRAEIFNYQSFRKTYEICDEMVSSIGSMAFIPQINPIDEYLKNTIKFIIRLTRDGNLDYISFSFQSQGWSNVSGQCTLSYDNIGTTELPYDLVVE